VCGTDGVIISTCKLRQTGTAFFVFNNFGRLVEQSDLAEMHRGIHPFQISSWRFVWSCSVVVYDLALALIFLAGFSAHSARARKARGCILASWTAGSFSDNPFLEQCEQSKIREGWGFMNPLYLFVTKGIPSVEVT
jgi:hypothetical protein